MKLTCTALACLAGFIFFIGYFGDLHPILDALAAGRYVALVLALVFVSLRAALGRRPALSTIPIAALVLGAAAQSWPEDETPGDVRVYSKNLLYLNEDVAPVIGDIQSLGPDIVILQEVSDRNTSVLTGLEAALPHQEICPWQGWNGMAILSRWPLTGTRCAPERSLMAVRVERPERPFWAVGVHLQQPWPDVQWLHLRRAMWVIDGLDAGAIVAGDFNTVPWSAAAQTVGRATNTKLIPPRHNTFDLWGVGIPIDHIWAGGGRVELRPRLGSDHSGLVADVWPSKITE